MAVFLRDGADRSAILRDLIKNQTKQGIKFHRNYREKLAPGWTVWGAEISPELAGLWVNFWDEDDFRAMIVCGGGAELHIGLFGSDKPSAGFAQVDGKVWLLRTNRVHRDQKPLEPLNEKIQIDNRFFYKIAQISDPNFIEKVLWFHLSRKPSAESNDFEESSSSEYRGGRGSSPHKRNAADVDPRHPVVFDTLVDSLRLNEQPSDWKNLDSKRVPTDLYLSHRMQRFIFEIKPYTNITTIGQAIGQLLLYKHLLDDSAARIIAVIPNEGCSDVLREGLAVQGIEILGFNWEQGQPTFLREDIFALEANK